jgi:hypothetical protein
MMKKTTLYLFMMVALIACGDDDDDADSGKKPDYIAAVEEMDMPESNETTLSIKANCKWVLVADVDWLFFDPAFGENNVKVTVTASPNKTGATRTATIFMRNETNTLERTVTVHQKKAPDNSFVPEPGENPLPN